MSELQAAGRRPRTGPAAATIVLLLVAAMWVAEVLDYILPVEMDYWGIESRSLDGLPGVVLAPFLHADFGHLMSNTVPLLFLGLLVAWRAGRATVQILAFITVVSGLAVWLLAPDNVITIGASGVVFGLMGYLLVAGIITRRLIDILLSIGVLLLYGGLLLGVTPFGASAGISWLAHLSGFAAGVIAAILFAPGGARQV